jgi:hypothetical protein
MARVFKRSLVSVIGHVSISLDPFHFNTVNRVHKPKLWNTSHMISLHEVLNKLIKIQNFLLGKPARTRTFDVNKTRKQKLLLTIIIARMTNNLENQAILRRVGRFFGEQQPICPNSILLNASKTTTFGRTVASNVRLLSCKVPLMISRKHASIIFEDEKWMIVDHNVSG